MSNTAIYIRVDDERHIPWLDAQATNRSATIRLLIDYAIEHDLKVGAVIEP